MKNIFIGNLDYQTNKEELMTAFSAFGAVERVNLITDRDTGQPRGFAFVEMPNDDEADAAVNALNGSQLGRRRINVNEARPREAGGGGGAPRGDRPFRGGPRSGPGGGNRHESAPQAQGPKGSRWWES